MARQKRAEIPGGRALSYRVRLSDQEAEVLEQRAAAQGVSVARLLLETTLTGRSPTERRAVAAELAVIRRQLTGAARNLNQATRVLHANGSSPMLESAASEVRAAIAMLDGVRW